MVRGLWDGVESWTKPAFDQATLPWLMEQLYVGHELRTLAPTLEGDLATVERLELRPCATLTMVVAPSSVVRSPTVALQAKSIARARFPSVPETSSAVVCRRVLSDAPEHAWISFRCRFRHSCDPPLDQKLCGNWSSRTIFGARHSDRPRPSNLPCAPTVKVVFEAQKDGPLRVTCSS
jgi:hypothetical protein